MSAIRQRRAAVSGDTLVDRQALVRRLLCQPWLTKADDAVGFASVKEHYEYLRDWFFEHAGYALYVTRGFAKLEKVPGVYCPWMGIDSFHSPRDYGLFTYGLWYLESKGEGEQFLLTEMVEAIRDHVLGGGTNLDWTLYDHRLSMVRALKKLRELGVLTSIEGDETGWAREGSSTNVLYEASPLARFVLRRFSKELMAYRDVDELYEVEQMQPASVDEERTSQTDARARRHKVFRRLLFEPVVYDWAWTEEERRYVQTQRSWLIHQIGEATGLEGRRFREGLYYFWPELMTQMDLFPTLSAVSDMTLLFARYVREEMVSNPQRFMPDAGGCIRFTRGEFEGILRQLREEYELYWTKDHREKTTAQLATELLEHMEEWHLGAADGHSGVTLFPGLSRFSGMYLAITALDAE